MELSHTQSRSSSMMDCEGDTKYPPNSQKFAVENVGHPLSNGSELCEDDHDNDKEVEKEENIDYEDDDDEDGGNVVQRITYDDYENSMSLRYKFAPRVPAPLSIAATAPEPSYAERNQPTDWTEQESFVLLDALADRFLKRGKKSLSSKEWQEIAEKVNLVSKVERTSTQCRNRLGTLKKKYKKEKMKVGEPMDSPYDWVYFKKMDSLLSCGSDSGEYIFMNPKVSLNRVNGVDKVRYRAGNSEARGNRNGSKGLPSKRKHNRGLRISDASLKILADSIKKFGEIYEKVENSKRQQMLELEKMRMDIYKDLELCKRQILERAQAEIAKIQQGDG